MLRIIIGIIIGVCLTLAALNPNDAKIATSKAVDTIHKSYVTGAKTMAEPEEGTTISSSDADRLSPELKSLIAKELADVKKQK